MKKQRQNFLPTFLTSIFLWILICLILYLFPPNSSIIILIFLIILFFALFLSFSLFFANSRRGLFFSLFIIIFLILRLLKIGHPLNLLLLILIFLTLEIYFSKR